LLSLFAVGGNGKSGHHDKRQNKQSLDFHSASLSGVSQPR
jgi:hypothetical protein